MPSSVRNFWFLRTGLRDLAAGTIQIETDFRAASADGNSIKGHEGLGPPARRRSGQSFPEFSLELAIPIASAVL